MPVHLPMMPSASGLDDASICPVKCVLPKIGSVNDSAERGTHCHTFLELVGNGLAPDFAALKIPRQFRDWCLAIDTSDMFAGLTDLRLEIPIAVDVDAGTARLLRKTGHRGYDDRQPHEFVGTVDVWAMRNGRTLIRDYKTGRNLGDPAFKLQLRFAALAVHLLNGTSPIDVEFTYIYEDSTFEHVGAPLDSWAMGETLDQLRDLKKRIERQHERRVAGDSLEMVTGDHCKFCECYVYCPSKTGLLGRVMDLDVNAIDDCNAGLAWSSYIEMKNLVDRMKPLFHDMVIDNSIRTPSGSILKHISSSKKSLSATKLASLARNLGATEREIQMCTNVTEYQFLKEVFVK